MDRRTLLTLSASAVATGSLASGAFAQDSEQEVQKTIEIHDPTLGHADAPIELIEYASFTCPHCAVFHSSIYPKLKADYIETGKVKFLFRDVYFNRVSLWASMVARCGGNDRFFSASTLIFEKQADWLQSGDPAIAIAELRKLGKISGLSQEQLDSCLKDADMAKALVEYEEKTVASDNISSTPSFIINGNSYSNMGYDELREVLDGLL